MNIERTLIDRIGDVGRKLHTGRSRNDQVSTDFRLWVRDAIDSLDGLLRDVQRAFVSRADADAGVILPGYTHLQRAQPVLAAHYWLAYCEKFERDREPARRLPPPREPPAARHGRAGRHDDPHRPPDWSPTSSVSKASWPTASTSPATATSPSSSSSASR